MLKSIRDITGQVIDRDELETWYAERDRLKKKKKTTKEERNQIKELQHKIYMMMYIPLIITSCPIQTKSSIITFLDVS